MDITLQDFLNKFATRYEEEKDEYERPAYDRHTSAGKNTPIYNAHSYHTKVPPQGIEPYILHYTNPEDLVLDPFCGSGMTGVAAMKHGRAVILNDLSPAACHIAKNYCTPVSLDLFRQEFNKIESDVKDEFDWLYGTTCDCGREAIIQYTIWSDVYVCPNCGSDIILWEEGVEHSSGQVKETFRCPNDACNREWRKRDVTWVRSTPVRTNYTCPECKRKEGPTKELEKKKISEIDAATIPYWHPKVPFDQSREMWRAVHGDHGITDSSRFYTKRNLWALARLWMEVDRVGDKVVSEHLRFIITSCFGHLELLTRYKFGRGGNSALNGTLYIGSITVEDNPLRLLKTKISQVTRAFQELSAEVNGWNSFIITGSASKLTIPDTSIDYIFTDPPFGSNIFYSDLNFLWESWLGCMTDEKKEAVVHVKHKDKNTLSDYKRLMTESLQEMYRVLKPNHWATLIFSNSDDDVWAAIQEAAQIAGFVVRGGREFDKLQRSYKGTKGAKGEEKVATKDVILNLHKPRVPIVQGVDLKKVDDVEEFVLKELRETLLHMSLDVLLQERTSEALARAVTRRVIEHGYSMRGMSFNYIEDVLLKRKGEFVNVEGGWYLVSARPDLARITDEQSAIVWLTTQTAKEPKRFDELNTLWQQELNKTKYRSPDGLATLLDTWFLKDDQGRYYPPDEYQRKEIKGLIEGQRHREAERYRAGKLDRQPTLEEIFQWIDVYYTRQHWDMVAELGKSLAIHGDWVSHEGGKNASMRIQLASAKLSSKKDVAYYDQEELF